VFHTHPGKGLVYPSVRDASYIRDNGKILSILYTGGRTGTGDINIHACNSLCSLRVLHDMSDAGRFVR